MQRQQWDDARDEPQAEDEPQDPDIDHSQPGLPALPSVNEEELELEQFVESLVWTISVESRVEDGSGYCYQQLGEAVVQPLSLRKPCRNL